VIGIVLALVAALGAAARIEAHEIGTTHVTVRLHAGATPNGGSVTDGRRFDIDVETDAAALLDKLETLADRPGPAPTAADFPERLAAFEALFRDRVAVAFDGAEARPDVRFAVTPPRDDVSPWTARIRLTGAIPPGASRVTWTYGWTFASYALSIGRDGEDAAANEWLEGGQTSTPFALATPAARAGRAEIAWQYFVLGFTHILPKGVDHVLFVLGLFLLGSRWRSILWQVSAFTLAHSITLGLSMYGLIGAPPSVVEPLIAISIAYVAVENLVLTELKPWRVALVFVFGLLHGMGFAGVLTELGLPRGEFVTALVTFNAGVEAGQMTVIALAFALVGWLRGDTSYRRWVVVPASFAIACMAAYWTIERLRF
jgi:hypothetical protein